MDFFTVHWSDIGTVVIAIGVVVIISRFLLNLDHFDGGANEQIRRGGKPGR